MKMNGYKHSESTEFTHLAAKGKTGAKLQKIIKYKSCCFFPPKAHKHTVQPLGTFLKLSFDMIEFSYAQ